MSKVGQLKKNLVKVNKAIGKGHAFYNGKPIVAVQQWLQWEIETRSKHGDKAREAFLK